jgi:ribosomal protein S18 acetylase RimI-like enzyme
MDKLDNITISNTTSADLPAVLRLFEQALTLQGKNGYKVWNNIDQAAVKKDIENKLHYKIINGTDILCIFSIQFSDPFIWQERDQNDAIYLHRIVASPKFKGQKQFQKVLDWAVQKAIQQNLKFVRMDTWADNDKIIEYYKSFGFKLIEYYKTPDTEELPVQNRNLNVVLMELSIIPK